MGKESIMEGTGACRFEAGRAGAGFFVVKLGRENGRPGDGMLFCPELGQVWQFNGIAEAVLLMDETMNRIQGEREEGSYRRFGNQRSKRAAGSETGWNMGNDSFGSGGSVAFIVHIYYREKMDIQGEITWCGKNQKQYFRSALELLSLIDSAVKASK